MNEYLTSIGESDSDTIVATWKSNNTGKAIHAIIITESDVRIIYEDN